ncbi:MAG: NAD-dependent epimerase/dehydratase, partial [bacterium]
MVTGESGFIGRHLSAALAADGYAVHGLSRRSGVDITDAKAVRETVLRVHPAAIYHLAGPSFVPDSRREPERFRVAHVDGTRNLLEAARDLRPHPRILLVGTADSYRPDPGNIPFEEWNAIEPE